MLALPRSGERARPSDALCASLDRPGLSGARADESRREEEGRGGGRGAAPGVGRRRRGHAASMWRSSPLSPGQAVENLQARPGSAPSRCDGVSGPAPSFLPSLGPGARRVPLRAGDPNAARRASRVIAKFRAGASIICFARRRPRARAQGACWGGWAQSARVSRLVRRGGRPVRGVRGLADWTPDLFDPIRLDVAS